MNDVLTTTARQAVDERARTFFDGLWTHGDPWQLDTSSYDQQKYDREMALIADRRYGRVLELGCGAGAFSRRLATIAESVVAVDVSPSAIAAAQRAASDAVVEYRVANIMDVDPVREGPWDLVVMSETVYYLGWLYPFFDVAWLAHQLFEALRPGGRTLMTNTTGERRDTLLRPWILATYRDLFVNVGYRVERQEVFRGSKNETDFEALITVLLKSPDPSAGSGMGKTS